MRFMVTLMRVMQSESDMKHAASINDHSTITHSTVSSGGLPAARSTQGHAQTEAWTG